jgi:hypothetical protein
MRGRIVRIDLELDRLGQLRLFRFGRSCAGRIDRRSIRPWLNAGIGPPHAQDDNGAEAGAGYGQPIEKAAPGQLDFVALFRRRLLQFMSGIMAHVVAHFALLRHNVEQEQFGETERMLQPERRDILNQPVEA